jgi:hypothetical protein
MDLLDDDVGQSRSPAATGSSAKWPLAIDSAWTGGGEQYADFKLAVIRHRDTMWNAVNHRTTP